VLLGALLRLPTLGAQSVWFDEAATWELTRMPFGEMLSALPHRESNPPLFYILEWGVTRAFGDGEFSLRLLSALAGIALVWVAYAIGERVGGRKAAVGTALLVAVNPLLVWYAQEARSYELVALLSAASLLLFLRALDDPRRRVLAWWALVSALALCTHYFAWFVLLPQAVWLLWRHPRRRDAGIASGALLIVSAALLPLLLAQRGNPYDIASSALAVRVLQVPKQFLLGYHGPVPLACGVAGAGLVAIGLWLLWARARGKVRERGLLLMAIAILGVLLPVLGALAGFDYVNSRNLIPALVPALAALAAGFAADGSSGLRRHDRRSPVDVVASPRAVASARSAANGATVLGAAVLAALAAISVAIVIAVAVDAQYQRTDWRGLAQGLGRSAAPRAIVVSPANGFAALRYYRPGLRLMPAPGAPVREVDVTGVAGSTDPGEAPSLPRLVGTQLPIPGFGAGTTEASDRWTILRFQDSQPAVVPPVVAAQVRFSEDPPTVALLPAGR
jgi:4-amino-4-deoxy-L-arabinose transferase-like glycosyltransferase